MRGVTLFEITDGQIVAGRLYMEDVERDVTGIEQAVEDLSAAGRGRAAVGRRSTPQPPIEWLRTPESSALTCRRRTRLCGGQRPGSIAPVTSAFDRVIVVRRSAWRRTLPQRTPSPS